MAERDVLADLIEATTIAPVTADELGRWAEEERNADRRIRRLPPDHEGNCESCEGAPAIVALTWIDDDGLDHEPYLCASCLERDFRDQRLLKEVEKAHAAMHAAVALLRQMEHYVGPYGDRVREFLAGLGVQGSTKLVANSVPATIPYRRRLKSCLEEWPDAEPGAYNPSCCRFPKSCSCTSYDPTQVTDDDLEPMPAWGAEPEGGG